MKRMKRNPEKFDPLELFTEVGRENHYRLDSKGNIKEFLDRMGMSLNKAIATPTILHGKRAEAMFAHVAGALGHCRLIKKEDGGAIFVNGSDLKVPDYRLVLADGTALLIEVKNFHLKDLRKDLTIDAADLSKLEAYAALNGLPLKLAIYCSNLNSWVLLSREAFNDDGDVLRVNIAEAIARSEMALLGDKMIGTRHDLQIDFLGDPAECSAPDEDGYVPFTICETRIYCASKEVTDSLGKRIAFYLMRYGEWIERDDHDCAIMQDGKLVGMRFIYAPSDPAEGQDFQVVGALSKMVSNAFKELTVQEGNVVALDVEHDPDVFSLGIPEDYTGSLPLWRLVMQPNRNFRTKGE